MNRVNLLIIALAISFLYTGCEVAEIKKEIPEAAPVGAVLTIQEPEKMAAELWNIITSANYRENWNMWPGKQAFYEGFRPHGVLLTTYVNDAAHKAIETKAGMLPDGAVIVTENYKRDKEIFSITVMCKVKDYNPAANDWFWAKLWPDGKVKRSFSASLIGQGALLCGKVERCIECHGDQSENDYIYTGYLKQL